MELHIKPSSDDILKMYHEHSFARTGDSGLDLFFPENVIIPAGETLLVDLGIACELRVLNTTFKGLNKLYKNKSFLLLPRSSIYKTPLRLANSIGLIDAGYRGNLKVALDNVSDKDYSIEAGQKLFQLVAPNLESFSIIITDSLSKSDRDTKGFGSSGK